MTDPKPKPEDDPVLDVYDLVGDEPARPSAPPPPSPPASPPPSAPPESAPASVHTGPPLAYRGGGDEADIVAVMSRRDTFGQGQAAVLLAAGIGLCFVTVVVAAVLAGGTLAAFGVEVRFGLVLLLALVTLLPLLFFLEYRAHGEFRESGDPDYVYGQYGAPTFGAAVPEFVHAVAEFVLGGPRLVLQAAGLRSAWVTASRETMATAAQVVRQLLDAGEGVPRSTLLRPGEPPELLDDVLTHLESRDWIGRSRDGNRVWIDSGAKKYLLAVGVRPPATPTR